MHTSIISDLWPDDKLLSCEETLRKEEKFLNELDQGFNNRTHPIYLRFWELSHYAVVLGRSNKKERETIQSQCQSLTIPIIKRPSGGGTVILGPGCLCYSLFLPANHPSFDSISKTTNTVMQTHCKALNQSKISNNNKVSVQGVSDLCFDGFKFSGNAQRRKKNSILFHGTFLYNFDLDLISQTLQHPSKEPDYRQQKDHQDFVKNISLASDEIQSLITCNWHEWSSVK